MSGTPRPGAPSLTARVALSCIAIFLAWAAPAAAVDLDPSDDPLLGQLVPGRRRQPGADDGVHRLGAVPERRARRARARPERRGHRFQGREQGGRARGLGPDDREPGGVNPAKDNIRDAWAAVDQPGSRTFAYLAFAREKAEGGTTLVTFEFNRDSRLWDNGRATDPLPADGRHPDLVRLHGATSSDRGLAMDRRRRPTATSGCATAGTLTEHGLDVTASASRARSTSRRSPTRLPGAYRPTDATRPLRRDGAEPRRDARTRRSATTVSRSARSGCTRAPRTPSTRRCRTTWRRGARRRTCAAAGTKFFDLDADG